MGEEETRGDEKVTWDGHSSSAEAAARAARANVSLNEQIEQIHRNKGLIASRYIKIVRKTAIFVDASAIVTCIINLSCICP